LIPVVVVVLFTGLMVQLSLSSPRNKDLTLPLPSGGGVSSIIANVSLFISIAIVAIVLVFLSKRLRKEYASNLFVAVYLVVGTVFTLLFGKQFFNVPENSFPLIYLVFGVVGYLGFYSIYLIVTGIVGENLKNFIFLTYSSIIGMFLGLSLPIASVIAVILALSFVDIFWVYQQLRGPETEDGMEKFMIVLKTIDARWGIGLGDLTCYAMLVTCSLANFGALNCLFSIILVLIGALSSMNRAEKYTYFPGLPMSAGLGAIPILISSIILA